MQSFGDKNSKTLISFSNNLSKGSNGKKELAKWDPASEIKRKKSSTKGDNNQHHPKHLQSQEEQLKQQNTQRTKEQKKESKKWATQKSCENMHFATTTLCQRPKNHNIPQNKKNLKIKIFIPQNNSRLQSHWSHRVFIFSKNMCKICTNQNNHKVP